MSSANPPVKHHYIPKFLLAQWATNAGKLWRYLQPVPGKIVTKLVAPAEIGYEEHLYATPGFPAEQAQQIEQLFMSPLDSLAADAHQLLLAGKVAGMPQRERSAWSRFIMSQWFRTPDNLSHFKEAMRLALTVRDDALDARYQELRKDGYPESLEAIIEMMGPEFVEQTAMGLLRKMSDDEKNGLRLNNMQWAVIETSGGREFLLSDAALVQGSAGIFSPQGYATMPVGPRKLFVAASHANTIQQIRALARNDLVSRNNRAVVRRASIFVGASDLSQTPWIKQNFGQEDNNTLIKGLAERYRETFSQSEAEV